ncbi:MAG: hypothetical protein H0X66_00700 [Verrucomicrobia bacterium]|nr:hypothetical protein [Verrucomicrobiota bacterium]
MVCFFTLACGFVGAAESRSLSGIYPHLAMFNDQGECGTGAVVPWADRLWVITYSPHQPSGSADKLYEITPGLSQIIRPESVGGTPANRMFHRESQQLFIGPYAIDAMRNVRAISPETMRGRHTGNARHLFDPATKIYYATMEEGFYEVDVQSLAVKELYPDANFQANKAGDLLPGYHGKGSYSGQGRLVYANNGERSVEARQRPDIASGALAEWDGRDWRVVRRNQFTEVTGPGGLYGNARPDTDPIWSIGWDHRSLILMLLDGGEWHSYRLPKASHSYDGAHGWNTEWPRIRDIGEREMLMTMHGMFWRFPRTFTAGNSAGIRPRSAYLKVIGDFCRWNDQLVFGCDDSAKSEFLNKRKVKGDIEGPGESQSNLWFTNPKTPDRLGPTLASGAVWLRDAVKSGEVSEPFLFAGWERRSAHFVNDGKAAMSFMLERDKNGNGGWTSFRTVSVGAGESAWVEFGNADKGEWVRVRAGADCAAATVHFTFSNADKRSTKPTSIFKGLASVKDNEAHLGGIVRARGEGKRTLQLAAMRVEGTEASDVGYYELDAALQLRPVDDVKAHEELKAKVAIPRNVVKVDAASVLVVDDRGRRWRLPKGDAAYDAATTSGLLRISREVATERDLFSAHGTFFELPAENADGFAKIRPVATHPLRLMDYCSYRGLLILTGMKADGPRNEHIIRSADGKAAVWAGAIDDVWKLGKPTGTGGPWKDTAVKAGKPSDPYLLWGYDQRHLTLRADEPATVTVEADLTGDGLWVAHKRFAVKPGKAVSYKFPASFQARWLRFVTDKDCGVTAQLDYR